jgi:hypothetical protein
MTDTGQETQEVPMTQSWNDETSSSSTAQTAKQEAGSVASQASEQASQVAGTVQEQGAKVATEAKDQALNLLSQARSQFNEQAGTQQERAAGGLRGIANELESMSNGSLSPDSSGPASDMVRQVSQHVQRAADWLETRDADGILNDVRTFARRKPGTFLLVAAGTGLLAGRVTRATTQAVRSDSQSDALESYSTTSVTDYPSAPLTPPMAAPASVPSTGYATTDYTSPAPSTYGTGADIDPTGAPRPYGQEPTTYGEEPLR